MVSACLWLFHYQLQMKHLQASAVKVRYNGLMQIAHVLYLSISDASALQPLQRLVIGQLLQFGSAWLKQNLVPTCIRPSSKSAIEQS